VAHARLAGARAALEDDLRGSHRLLAEHAPDALALEESYVGADARIALSVGQARGAVLVAGALAGVACAEYAPARVKQSVCGYGRADKGQVQRMVTVILGSTRRCRTTLRTRSRVAVCPRSPRRSEGGRMIAQAPRQAGRADARTACSSTSAGVGYLVAATPARCARPRAPPRSASDTYLPRARGRAPALRLRGHAERELFLQLLSVNGVGPKVALRDLSSASAVRPAPRHRPRGHARLQATSGIGKKTASGSCSSSRRSSARVVAAVRARRARLLARDALVELGWTIAGRRARARPRSTRSCPSEEQVRVVLKEAA
jgi:crossover junction endodeoxyribonuclease RuvC